MYGTHLLETVTYFLNMTYNYLDKLGKVEIVGGYIDPEGKTEIFVYSNRGFNDFNLITFYTWRFSLFSEHSA